MAGEVCRTSRSPCQGQHEAPYMWRVGLDSHAFDLAWHEAAQLENMYTDCAP